MSKTVLQMNATQHINKNIHMALNGPKLYSCSKCHVLYFQLAEITWTRKRNCIANAILNTMVNKG